MPLVPLAPIARPIQGVRVQAAQQAVNTRADQQTVQAIQQAGGAVVGLLDRYNELTDTRNLIEAEEVMRAKTQEFNTWRRDPANADESQWLPKWQEMQNATQKHIDGLKITDRARLNLSRSFGQWADKQTISVQGDAFKNAGRRTGAALQLRIEQGEGLGDDGQIESSYGAAVKTGVMLQEEAELAKFHSLKRAKATRVGQFDAMLDADMSAPDVDWQEIRERVKGNPELTDSEKKIKLANIESTHVRRASMDEVQALTLTNPTEAAKRLESGEWASIPDGDRQVAIAKAKEVRAAGASDTFRDTLARIKLGQAKPTEEFNAPDMQDITPLMRDILKATNEEYHSKEAKAARLEAMNNPVMFQRMETEIEAYRPSEGDGLKRAEFEAVLETNFSGPYLEGLKQKWADKTQAAAPSLVETAEAFQSLDKWAFDDQRFGTFKQPVLDKDGKPVLVKKSGGYRLRSRWFWGDDYVANEPTFEPEMKEDPRERDRVAKSVSTIKETIRREVKEGKLIDSNAVFKRMAELAKMPITTKAAAETSGVPTAATGGTSAIGTTLPTIDGVTSPSIDSIRKRHAQNPRK